MPKLPKITKKMLFEALFRTADASSAMGTSASAADAESGNGLFYKSEHWFCTV